MNGINENVSETGFVLYERKFNVKDKTIDNIFEYSLTVKDEISQILKNVIFLEEKTNAQKERFWTLVSSCINIAIASDAKLSIINCDFLGSIFINMEAKSFCMMTTQLALFSKVCLFASDIDIYSDENQDECTVSIRCDFSEDGKPVIDFISKIYS